MRRIISVFIVLLFNTLHFDIYARFATRDDFDYEVSAKYHCDINKDGTYTQDNERKFLILKEGGKQVFANFQMLYTEGVEKVEIIEAYSYYDGKKYVVDKSKIEDKSLASRGNGFDQIRQLYIPFNNIHVGGEIYIRTKTKVFKSSIPEFFSALYSFEEYVKELKTTFNSEVPLYFKANDIYNVLKVTSSNDKRKHVIELKKPFTDTYIEEGGQTLLPFSKKTYFTVSSENTWKNIKRYFSEKYNERINDKLPKKLTPLVQNLRKQKNNAVDLLNSLTSYVQEHYQYFGNWTTIEGKLIPRKLSSITDSSIGDCKDFATIVAAVINNIEGYKASVALIARGEIYDYRIEYILPSVDSFNHAIVHVVDPNGEEYWIDPTNRVSMAGKMFSDISSRPTLVLNSDLTEELRYTSQLVSSDNVLNISKEFVIKDNNDIYGKYEGVVDGLMASDITEGVLFMTKLQRENYFYTLALGQNIRLEDRKGITISDFPRIVDKVKINLEAVQRKAVGISNLGNTIQVGMDSPLPPGREDIVATYYIDYPHVVNKRLLLKDVDVPNIEKLNTSYKTEWFEYSRQLRSIGNDVEIVAVQKLLKSFLSAEEIKSDAYRKLEDFLAKNKNITVVFQKR